MSVEAKAVTTRMQAPLDPLPGAMTPTAMLDRAVASGANIEVIEKLMGLQERWEANQARKAFVEAFAAFKAEAIQIVRNKDISDGPLKGKKYADLYSFVEAVTPALSKHGLSASWDITKDEKEWIEVTCIVEHVLGHSKRVSFGAAPDAGGSKNAIHARASTVSYLERYTLKAATGLAESGDDDDAQAASGNGVPISEDQLKQIQSLIIEVNADTVKLCKYFKVGALTEIPAVKFDSVIAALETKRQKA